MIATSRDALDELKGALADVDNQVGASIALMTVVGRFRPEAPTQWDAFQLGAEKLLEPWFKDTTQAAVWAVASQYRDRKDSVHQADDAEAGSAGARVRCMADVEPEEVTWLWYARIPRGKLSEIVGDPGAGKSTVTLEIVACKTTGRPLPGDEFGGEHEPINVLLLNAEDGAGDTIRPRLDRAGADVSRVHIFDGIERADGVLDPFDLKDAIHRSYLASLVEDLDIGLLVIDPLNAYLGGGTDSHKDAEVRGVLAPLAALAETSGCAVLTVRHLTKGSTTRAMYRAGGSIAFTAAARCSMLVGQVDEESDDRALVVVKLNLTAVPPPVGFSLADGQFKWNGTPDVSASDLLRPDADSDERTDRSDTVEWLLAVLEGGPVPSGELFTLAKEELSVTEKTVKRARYTLGDKVEVCRESTGNEGGGRWIWKLARRTEGDVPLAKSENVPLAGTVIPQGLSASDGAKNPQGGQGTVCGPLADSDAIEAPELFEDLGA